MIGMGLASIVLGLAAQPALGSPSGFFPVDEAPPTQLLVDFTDMNAEQLAQIGRDQGLVIHFNSEFSDAGEDLAVVELDSPDELQRLKDFFARRDDVEAVEPNYQLHALFTPNDPLFKHQWNMQMIHAEQAWDSARGRGVVVAVIDTGVSSGRGALKAVEDLRGAHFVGGYDFVHDRPQADDDHAHGTHVAGTIAQVTDNKTGVAGVAFEAKIMPIKVLSARGAGTISDIAEGIMWATDHGANVINMSLGGPFPSPTLAKAVLYARSHGVVVVCAAGNSGRRGVGFPAALPGAFAVSALGPGGELAPYSSWGKAVAIAAPGGDTTLDLNKDGLPDGVMQNTIRPGQPSMQGYLIFQGTSMASPHVAGVAALVISQGITRPGKVMGIIERSAHDLGDADRYGAGRLDAEAAVHRAIWHPGLLRLILAVLLAFLIVRLARKKNALTTPLRLPAFAVSLIIGACGLFFVRGLEASLPFAFVITRPILEWPGALLGWSWHLNIFVGSALPALGLAVLVYGSKRLRPVVAGLAIGMGAYLLACAIDGSVDVRWLPGLGLFDRLWLGLNAGLALLMGRMSLPSRN